MWCFIDSIGGECWGSCTVHFDAFCTAFLIILFRVITIVIHRFVQLILLPLALSWWLRTKNLLVIVGGAQFYLGMELCSFLAEWVQILKHTKTWANSYYSSLSLYSLLLCCFCWSFLTATHWRKFSRNHRPHLGGNLWCARLTPYDDLSLLLKSSPIRSVNRSSSPLCSYEGSQLCVFIVFFSARGSTKVNALFFARALDEGIMLCNEDIRQELDMLLELVWGFVWERLSWGEGANFNFISGILRLKRLVSFYFCWIPTQNRNLKKKSNHYLNLSLLFKSS